MALGRKHDVLTIMNPAPARALTAEELSNVDVLTPNESELRILLGLPPDDPTPTPVLAEALRGCGVKNIIVTMGDAGALILQEAATTQVPGVPVSVVDTTGAGDAFNAGLAVALAEGRSLIEAVRYGNCAGALACTRLGVVEALGDRETVDELCQAQAK